MTDAQTYEQVQTALHDLKFLTAVDSLDALAQQAASEQWTYLRFLDHLTQAELAARAEQAVTRNTRRARFPFVKTLDQFDFACQPSINEPQVRDLATLRGLWRTARMCYCLVHLGSEKHTWQSV